MSEDTIYTKIKKDHWPEGFYVDADTEMEGFEDYIAYANFQKIDIYSSEKKAVDAVETDYKSWLINSKEYPTGPTSEFPFEITVESQYKKTSRLIGKLRKEGIAEYCVGGVDITSTRFVTTKDGRDRIKQQLKNEKQNAPE